MNERLNEEGIQWVGIIGRSVLSLLQSAGAVVELLFAYHCCKEGRREGCIDRSIVMVLVCLKVCVLVPRTGDISYVWIFHPAKPTNIE